KAAGLMSGDIILRVNGESTFGWDLPKAVETIRGEKGTPVTLSVIHSDTNEIVDIEIVRDIIKIDSVTSWFRSFNCSGSSCVEEPDCTSCIDIAYIRVSQFGEKTND